MSGNFILGFPSINSPILPVTHAHAGKVVVCSLCCSRGPHINIHDVCGLYDRLIRALWVVEMRDAKRANSMRLQMLYSLTFNTRIISWLHIAHSKRCMVYAVIVATTSCHNFVLNKFFYAGLDHLRLDARETNFSPSFTPELALRLRHAYRFNPLVHRNSDLVRD